MDRKLNVLFLEPFYAGSHKDFADGLSAASRHRIDLFTLPGRFWKWRMRGAALYFYNHIKNLNRYDCLLTSGLMGLADFMALAPPPGLPAAVYFHENQLAYPLTPGQAMDVHFGFTDISSGLTADLILFNSEYQCHAFFKRLPAFLKQMPDCRPMWVIEALQRKSRICHPGCQFDVNPPAYGPFSAEKPAIVWNHRWEHDKNPDLFFETVDEMGRRDIDFELILLGERFKRVPQVFQAAKFRHRQRIRQYGYVARKNEYHNWLMRGTVVVSTAHQENFGISVVEAVRYGCLPLLPNRLSYPEILPDRYHSNYLYNGKQDLADKLAFILLHYRDLEDHRADLSKAMAQFAWPNRIADIDQFLVSLAAGRKGTQTTCP